MAEAQVLEVGTVVRLRSGPYGGRRATVHATTGVPGLEMIRVRMESDGALVEIGRKETFIVGPDELRENPFAPVPSAQRGPLGRRRKDHLHIRQ